MNEQRNILDQIVETKKREVEELPLCEFFMHQLEPVDVQKSFVNALKSVDGPALITEVKKKSPSKGVLREDFDYLQIAKDYQEGGAHCLSVLTDEEYFAGDIKYLAEISQSIKLPCLRKDFIIDPRQITEARLAGASAILLIAAILNDEQLKSLSDFAKGFGMDVLLEVHDEQEMERAIKTGADLIGINNRDLKTFEVSLNTSINLMKKFSSELEGRLVVSESGIYSKADIDLLSSHGIKAFLVGESLIKQEDLKIAVKQLLNE